MVTHDEGKRETRAWMKDRQCVSAIVCRQGRGLKQTHGAKWHCLGTGGFGWRGMERQKDSKLWCCQGKHVPENRGKTFWKSYKLSHLQWHGASVSKRLWWWRHLGGKIKARGMVFLRGKEKGNCMKKEFERVMAETECDEDDKRMQGKKKVQGFSPKNQNLRIKGVSSLLCEYYN